MTPYIITEDIMSQFEKLIQRIMSLSKDLRFEELSKVLEDCGYTMKMPGGGSSHAVFRKKGRRPITVPRRNPIKRVYVELVREVIE